VAPMGRLLMAHPRIGPAFQALFKRGHWSDAPLSPHQRALCSVAEKLSADPRLVGAEDWGSLHEVGLDDEGCLEVAHIVGVFNHLTRLADGFGLRVDPARLAAASGGPPLRRPSSALRSGASGGHPPATARRPRRREASAGSPLD